MNINQATLKLFNAIQTDKKEHVFDVNFLRQTIKDGFILDPSIDPSFLSEVKNFILSATKMNAAFHKSWDVVRDSSLYDLIMDHMVHYITTYGFESLGIFDSKFVYIPNEKLEIPENTENIPLVFIRGLSVAEILDEINLMVGSGIALSQDTLDSLKEIVKFNNYKFSDFVDVKNREFLTFLYDHYNECPQEPEAFLRYLIYRATGETLLIKNNKLVAMLKNADTRIVDKILVNAPKNLASIFFRYKPLFLALKYSSRDNHFFNRLRKDADKMHRPLKKDYAGSFTELLANGDVDLEKIEENLKKYSIFRKMRLAYALKFRKNNPTSIVYRVRNGKGWATEFDSAWKFGQEDLKDALKSVLQAIANDIRENVEGKTFYIPDAVHYAMPSSEKQFVGNIPAKTYFSSKNKDVVIGIQWNNQNGHRIDLDFSLTGVGGKFGWDGFYRSTNRDVLFSGDITDAPGKNGASELFCLRNGVSDPLIANVNWFNAHGNKSPVEFKLFVANADNVETNYNRLVDANKMIAFATMNVLKQDSVALLMNVNGKTRVIVDKFSTSNGITSRNNKSLEHAREYMVHNATNFIDMADVLIMAGANVVNEMPEDGEYVNLSPEALDKNSFISLFSK